MAIKLDMSGLKAEQAAPPGRNRQSESRINPLADAVKAAAKTGEWQRYVGIAKGETVDMVNPANGETRKITAAQAIVRTLRSATKRCPGKGLDTTIRDNEDFPHLEDVYWRVRDAKPRHGTIEVTE